MNIPRRPALFFAATVPLQRPGDVSREAIRRHVQDVMLPGARLRRLRDRRPALQRAAGSKETNYLDGDYVRVGTRTAGDWGE